MGVVAGDAIGPLVQAGFPDHHRTRLVELFDDGRVEVGHEIGHEFRADRRRDAFRIEEVFGGVRDAVQRTAVLAGGDLGLRVPGLPQSVLFGDGNERVQRGLTLLDRSQRLTRQINR